MRMLIRRMAARSVHPLRRGAPGPRRGERGSAREIAGRHGARSASPQPSPPQRGDDVDLSVRGRARLHRGEPGRAKPRPMIFRCFLRLPPLLPRLWWPAFAALCALGCGPLAPAPASPPAQAAPAPAAAADAGAPPADDEDGEEAAPSTGKGKQPKFDFDAMLARERPEARILPVVDPKGRWRSSIESKRMPLVVDRGDHVSIRAASAARDEVRCEVHEGQLNPGVTAANLLGAAAQSISIENASVYHVGEVREAPVLFVRAGYTT